MTSNSGWKKLPTPIRLGTCLHCLGTSLMGVGVVPQLAGVTAPLLTNLSFGGFIVALIGSFVTRLYGLRETEREKAVVTKIISPEVTD